MIGDPHSQLVPTSPSWSQLAPRSLAFSCQGVGVYRIQEICSCCCCQHFKIFDVVVAMVCANPKAKTRKIASWFAQFMAIASADWWCVPHIIQLDKAKSWTCSYCVSSMRKQKLFKNSRFCVILVECTVCSKTWSPSKPHPDVEIACHK